MNRQIKIITLLIFCSMAGRAQDNALRLWYEQPARQWEECVPLGNGHLGAMPNGHVFHENIVLNDITLWSGGKQDADAPEASRYLPEIRQLLFEGKNAEAETLMYKSFACKGAGSGEGSGAKVPYGSYEVLGNLHITYDYGTDSSSVKPLNYQRELSLNNAIASTRFELNGISYTREYFTSFDHDVIIVRLSADQAGKINIHVKLDRPQNFNTLAGKDALYMTGQLNNGTDGKGMKYAAFMKAVQEGGSIVSVNNALQIKNASTVTLYLTSATDFRNKEEQNESATVLSNALTKPYEAEKASHLANYQRLFSRVALHLGDDKSNALPTDQRLQAFARDQRDASFAALYFQFGRYLLMSSTRPGLLPPNLQGLWSNTIQSPWNGDYHLNINIQMNHWPLHVTNLAELNEPFFNLVKGLVEPGQKTAKTYYNADGWVAHMMTNVWGYTSPGEFPSWGAFNTGSAWSCQMLWDHYVFTRDEAYLEQLYPLLKGSAEFYLNTLVKDPATGWLMTSPSNSPENVFRLADGKEAHVCMGPTMDNQLIRALFGYVIESGKKLKRDDAFVNQLQAAIGLLPPNRIGKDGRLMEWLQEYEEPEPHHRHVSHLWALYPGNEITPEATPALAAAAKASLEGRGDLGVGWSLAWKVNFWARLHNGDRAYQLLKMLMKPTAMTGFDMSNGGGTYANFFCACPPFQIDGNFGGTAGIAEMLVQSNQGYIELLPALPREWSTGNFSGLCTREGGVVDAQWKNGQVKKAVLSATIDHSFQIKTPSYAKKIHVIRKGKTTALRSEKLMKFDLKKGEKVEVVFE